MSDFDVLVIGGGPGGYVGAIRCAQLGLRTACIDRWLNARGHPSLGGTCLNVGCIPSKALLDSSHMYEQMRKDAGAHGFGLGEIALDIEALQNRKANIVSGLTNGIAALFKKNGVHLLSGSAQLVDHRQVRIEPSLNQGEPSVVSADHIIIATGSLPAELSQAPFDGRAIVDSSGALEFDAVPSTLGIVGAGVIGLELGSVWRRLGAKVTIFEALDTLLPAADRDIANEAKRVFRRQGLDIKFGVSVERAEPTEKGVALRVCKGGESSEISVDKLIVAVGRRPSTAGLGASECGLALDAHGYVKVDAYGRTNLPGVYAIGDVTRGPMLAHRASHEAIAIATTITAGSPAARGHEHVPWIVYTHPEIAWIGEPEYKLQEAQVPYAIGRMPFRAIGRAHAMGCVDGFAKILTDRKTGLILGAHILGPNASELIAEVALARHAGLPVAAIRNSVHGHPSLSEALYEAAWDVGGLAINV